MELLRTLALGLAMLGSGGATSVCTPATAHAQGREHSIVATLLVRYEMSLIRSATSRAWAARRSAWSVAVQDSTSVTTLASLFMVLESAMSGSALPADWRQRREDWITRVRGARTLSDLARLLLELESVTNRTAFAPTWRDERMLWTEALVSVRGP